MSEGGGVSAAGGDNARTNLIVNYLPQTMTEKDLYGMFMTIGPIESCRVMKDFKTGYSYGFGFVNFTREEDASRAIDTFNGYQLRNKRLKVSYARPSGEDIKDTNLYVTNLPRAVNEDTLDTIFGKYGRIVQKHILRDKNNGSPRGVAFVRFDKREEAQEAIAALNNVIPEGGTEPLCVKVAEEHGKQKAAYYAGWAAGFHQTRDGPPEFDTDTDADFAPMPVIPRMPPIRPMPPVGQMPGPRQRRNAKMMAGDFAWGGCGGCMPADPWDQFSSQPLGGSQPPTPRNGCRGPGLCANPRAPFPNYMNKGPRPNRGRNMHWAPGYQEERFKGQRCRNGPSPYWFLSGDLEPEDAA